MRIAEFLFGSIALVIQFYAEKYRQDDYFSALTELENDSNLPIPKTYDFIIVGGGTAGCLLAGRLSEKFNVLLLEAGGTPPPAAEVPFFSVNVASDPNINYFFKTVQMSNGGVATMHTGKMLGGSGSHNDLVHNRGSPKDYDNFAAILEDPSWEYENVVEYFKRSETFIGKQFGEVDNSKYYGTTGPIIVDSQETPLLPIWFEAAAELGFKVGDPNGFQTESFTVMNKPMRNGRRSSTYAEFVKPHEQSRESLTVVRYANVSEILLNENNEAYGVAYTRHGIPQITYASKEVILSAGAFSSPLLLMKSGIGPVDTLNSAEIPVKVPLPAVGQNFKEHVAMVLGPFYVNNNDTSLFHLVFKPEDTEKVAQEYERGEGPLAALQEGPQCLKVSARAANKDWPNLSITPGLLPIRSPEDRPTVMFYVILGRPQSTGYISLNATAYKEGIRDDVQLAEIDFHFLEHEDDIEDLLEAIQLTFNITRTNAFQENFNLTYTRDPSPGCAGFPSDDYWRCHIRNEVIAWIHMVGSARLGPASGNSDTFVLDNKFRVRGVKFLRVVDASAMPDVPNTNLNAPVMMIAEKAVDNILEDWQPTITTTVPTTTLASSGPTTSSAPTTIDVTTKNTNDGVSMIFGANKLNVLFVSIYAFVIFVAG